MEKYQDRYHAGKLLASLLKEYADQKDVIVLALPRGGVPVAYEIAKILNAPLDIFVVRKLGVPGHEELAMGAIASGETLVLNESVLQSLRIPPDAIEVVKASEKKELHRREKLYRGNKPPLDVKDKKVILVDDGIATGATMRVAIKALKLLKPKEIIIAVPVAARETAEELANLVNKFVCLQAPAAFYAVGLYYENFGQTEDEEVFDLLNRD